MRFEQHPPRRCLAGAGLVGVLALAIGATNGGLAQERPGSLVVVGVDAFDVLNVRARPDAEAPLVGAIAAGSQRVEALDSAPTQGWRRVRHGGVEGWVNARFLAPNPYPSAQTPPEAELECAGTEPFWRVQLTPSAFRLETGIEGEARTWSRTPFERAAGRFNPWVVEATGPANTPVAVAILRRSFTCGDGMSDRTYVYDITVHEIGGTTFVGCCGAFWGQE